MLVRSNFKIKWLGPPCKKNKSSGSNSCVFYTYKYPLFCIGCTGEMISETLLLVCPVGHTNSEILFLEPHPRHTNSEMLDFRNPLCDTLLDFANVKMNFYKCCCNIFTDCV